MHCVKLNVNERCIGSYITCIVCVCAVLVSAVLMDEYSKLSESIINQSINDLDYWIYQQCNMEHKKQSQRDNFTSKSMKKSSTSLVLLEKENSMHFVGYVDVISRSRMTAVMTLFCTGNRTFTSES